MYDKLKLSPGTIKLRVRQSISHPNRQYVSRKIKTRHNRLQIAPSKDVDCTIQIESRHGADSTNSRLPAVGEVLVANYKFVSQLGKGGMGVIYKCKHPILDKFVAIKMLRHKHLAEEAVRRFQIEAQAASLLNHPNLITVFDFGVTPSGQPYMVMDYLEGKTLAEAISEGMSFTLPQLMDIFIQCCEGMSEAHNNNVLHRDLKSSNIILTSKENESPKVKIVDFGIAKILRQDEQDDLTLTKTGDVFGSPLYMSPEQGGGRRRVDARTDIYSLGCVLFEVLTGAPPFLGANAIETLVKHMTEKPSSLKAASLGKDFPQQLESLVMEMLEKDPADRPASMAEVRDKLLSIKEDLVSPQQRTAKGSVKERSKVHKERSLSLETLLIGLVIGLVIAVIVVIIWSMPEIQSHKLSSTLEGSVNISDNEEERAYQKQLHAELSSNYAAGTRDFILKDRIVSDKQFMMISRATFIQTLQILRCEKMTAQGFSHLKNMQLDSLQIQHSELDDACLAEIAQIQSLKALYINISGHKTTGVGLSQLAKLKRLQILKLVETNCDDFAVESFSLSLPELSELSLNDNRAITDRSLASVTRLRKLRELDVNNTSVTDEGMSNLLKMPNLHCLSLCGNRQITNRALDYVSQSRLGMVFLAGTSVDGNGLLKLKGMKSLYKVDASELRNVSRAQWHEFSRSIRPHADLKEPIFTR